MTLMAVFMYFTLTALGLGIATMAGLYQKMGRYKVSALRMSFAAETGAKKTYAFLAHAVEGRISPTEISLGRFAELREATAAGRPDLSEDALGLDIPVEMTEAEEREVWRSGLGVDLDFMEDRNEYFLAGFHGEILAEGWSDGGTRRKSASLEVGLKILAGRIPLAFIPLLVAGPNGSPALGDLLARKQVEVSPVNARRKVPGPATTASPLIPTDATAALEETLKVKILSPDKLSRAELRRALGLEMVNEPVLDGVYLINDDSGLGGIFVQGDVEELLLAVDAGWQYAQFKLEEGSWLLKFNPSRSGTVFQEPDGARAFDRTPLPIIMVNGRISSLGGGIVGPDGSVFLSTDPSVPNVVAGVSLVLVCADEVTITSHLVQEGVRWTDGLPYLKDSQSQLVIQASGRDFVDGTERSGKVKIGRDAPRELQIQASITAGGGFSAEEGAGDAVIAGSLQTAALDLGSSKVKIIPDERLLSGTPASAAYPKAAIPILWILSLEPLQWRE
jgi:hypothetical protein